MYADCVGSLGTLYTFPLTPSNPDWLCQGNLQGSNFQAASSAQSTTSKCVTNAQLPGIIKTQIGSIVLTCLHAISNGTNPTPSYILILFFFFALFGLRFHH